MRKIIYLMGFVLIALNAHSQIDIKNSNDSAVMVFADTLHDFGTILEADGKVTHVFEFKNEGKSPLIVLDAKASCGCTVPEWTKTPVEPGQSGIIEVTFNPTRRTGNFDKAITITSNSVGKVSILHIKGKIEPTVASQIGRFSHKIKHRFGMWDYVLGGLGFVVIIIAVIMFFKKKKTKNDRDNKVDN